MIYSYKHGFSGFSAMLTESQAQEIVGNFCQNMTIISFHLERRKKYQESQGQSHNVNFEKWTSIDHDIGSSNRQYKKPMSPDKSEIEIPM